jgi:two-component system CheB/CheR fusion protein
VFASLRSGVAVLDRDYRVQVWNHRAEDLWDIRRDETVGTQFLTLEIGLPVAQLAQSLRAVMNGEENLIEKTIPALTRRGRTIDCLVSVTPLHSADGQTAGVIILMDDSLQNS